MVTAELVNVPVATGLPWRGSNRDGDQIEMGSTAAVVGGDGAGSREDGGGG